MTPTSPYPKLLAARPLMMCVVLGAFTVAIVAITRIETIAMSTTLPWLSFPAPLPWFVPVIMATLLVRRSGAALVTGTIGAIGGGGMAFLAAIIVELCALPFKAEWKLSLWWAMLAGAGIGVMSFGFMFMFPEFAEVSAQLKIAGFIARILTSCIYGALAFWLVQKLHSIGIGGPSRP